MFETVGEIRSAFYRLTGSRPDDGALTELGESTNEVAYQYLTDGVWNAQRWMLAQGYAGWRRRSDPIVWMLDVDGFHHADLPTDFLRAWGDLYESALVDVNGKRWGRETTPRDGHLRGDRYFIAGEEIRLTQGANPPDGLTLDYHYRHPPFADDTEIDFPVEARALIVAEAAESAMHESWLPGGREMEKKIEDALIRARQKAIDIARPTKRPRQLRVQQRHANRW